jgi:hypothetical protein
MAVDRVWVGNRLYWTVETRNYKYYNAVSNSHTLQFPTGRTKLSHSAVSSPVVAW